VETGTDSLSGDYQLIYTTQYVVFVLLMNRHNIYDRRVQFSKERNFNIS
jgi:hypothetical protein